MTQPEPWLRGTVTGLHSMQAAVVNSYQQVREDLAKWTGALSEDDLWRSVCGLPSVGVQLKHIAGSVDRLTTYLMGEQLSERQMLDLKRESEPGTSLAALLQAVETNLARSEEAIRSIAPDRFNESRGVGRKMLPTTVGGLMVHLAEHTQRHLGQAITTVKALTWRP
jgi:uncharacterized damage-inducible protein DinB